ADLEPDELLDRLARLAVPDIADVCFVERGGRPAPDAPATMEPRLWRAIDDEARRALARAPEGADAIGTTDPSSALAVPLVAEGHPIGVLTLARRAGRPPFDEGDLLFAV